MDQGSGGVEPRKNENGVCKPSVQVLHRLLQHLVARSY